MLESVFAGFLLGGSLIVAIGAQNAFVIRQGVMGRHIFWVCLFCAASDAVLIWGGVFGLSFAVELIPGVLPVLTYGGAAFLVAYGVKALSRAWSPSGMGALSEDQGSLWSALASCVAFTFLNPHVYLDTVVLVGSIANARATGEQVPFAAGASVASLIWFFGLGYGAGALRHWLSQPMVWRVVDGVIAIVMFSLAARLLLG